MAETSVENQTLLPVKIGRAVYYHMFLRSADGLRPPDPDVPEDISDVVDTIMNHTGLTPDEVAEHLSGVQELIGKLTIKTN